MFFPNLLTPYEMRIMQPTQLRQSYFSDSFINTCNPYQNFLEQTYNRVNPMDNYRIMEPVRLPTLYETRIVPDPIDVSERLINSNQYLNRSFRESLKSSWE